ncbi:hypothetical protein L2E82_22554 [Cichorium intybus]|uniref:Uncharacterized protein n=1 Tax=Cichorium intybus TaxID=13427 RepID=A0ACB9DZ17_CICIN|nr:hypothetical protein L2E82_22554 [Cichorium intybus]
MPGSTCDPNFSMHFNFLHELFCSTSKIGLVLQSLNIPLSVETVCVFTAPVSSAFAACATYLLTKEVKGAGAGLRDAVLLAMIRYTFIINLIPMHVLLCIVLYIAYAPLVSLGTLLAALVPVVGFNAVMRSEHFASFFAVLVAVVASSPTKGWSGRSLSVLDP